MINEGLMTSNTCEWETPQALFDALAERIPFEVDVCATEENTKCRKFFTKEIDGLSQHWSGFCWMNPPYGREIGKWVKKASESKGAFTFCLLPARTDTAWFHDYIYNNADVKVYFLKGRLHFNNSKNSAPFPSMIVIFGWRVISYSKYADPITKDIINGGWKK